MDQVEQHTSCPTEDQLLEFLDGLLPSSEVARLSLHLDACAACRQSIVAAAEALGEPTSELPTLSPSGGTVFRIGEVVGGRYRLTGYLGAGGMGEVFAAEDTLVGGRVALKTVGPAVAHDPEALARMKREVQLARLITHPNVCRVHDFGLHRDEGDGHSRPVAFLTMELVEGESLGQKIRREGRIEGAPARELIGQMIAALEAAHAVGVTHRDFKPDNVLLAEGKEGPRVVVTDFGLASGVFMPASQRLTINSRALVGTAAYISPEQIEGHAVSAAADYYALGIVIFEMLTGKLPFAGPSPLSVAARRLFEAPPPLRKFVRDMEPRWEAIVAGCLLRDPQQRAAFVATQLPPLLQNVLTRDKASSGWGARRRALGIALVGALALASGFAARRATGHRNAHSSAVAAPMVAATPDAAAPAAPEPAPVVAAQPVRETVAPPPPRKLKPAVSRAPFGRARPSRDAQEQMAEPIKTDLSSDDDVLDAFARRR